MATAVKKGCDLGLQFKPHTGTSRAICGHPTGAVQGTADRGNSQEQYNKRGSHAMNRKSAGI